MGVQADPSSLILRLPGGLVITMTPKEEGVCISAAFFTPTVNGPLLGTATLSRRDLNELRQFLFEAERAVFFPTTADHPFHGIAGCCLG